MARGPLTVYVHSPQLLSAPCAAVLLLPLLPLLLLLLVLLPVMVVCMHAHCVCAQVRPPPLYTFKATLTKDDLPKKLDWRATPADFAVKDQGQCGSCWVRLVRDVLVPACRRVCLLAPRSCRSTEAVYSLLNEC